MRLKLQRAFSNKQVTLGMLQILGLEHAPFFTLENPLRTSNTDNRIPAGVYKCRPYSGTKYKDVFEVQNVPNRSAILIHWGNFESDTEGCILVGDSAGVSSGGKPAVLQSRVSFDRLKQLLVGVKEFELEIFDAW